MTTRLWRDLGQLLRSWWNHDRIRTSPEEGRFLRIQTGDLVTLGSIDAVVIDRTVTYGPTGLCIQLKCETETSTGELILTMIDLEKLNLTWIEADRQFPMAAADVQIWPMKHKIRNDM